MPQTSSRPPSVLITQVILIMVGGLWFVGGLLYLFGAVTIPAAPAQTIANLIVGLLMFAFSTSFLIGFWGLIKRRSYGRWIGVIGLSVLLLTVFLGNIFRPAGPLAYNEYSSGEVAGAVIAAIMFYGLIMFLIYRLARGKRANEFFSGEVTPPTQEPSPTPIF